ncbi:cation/acetate symporter ActP [Lichenibacterium minor]|uniref:Cation/acetate symporter ActP n=1 Tax=Lichenibacterium minor TaxID=2316528 RepID=A0A4Q2UE30_9HYPH|nr:cation/acetate symporter ActP [Lichenibacterium minor]
MEVGVITNGTGAAPQAATGDAEALYVGSTGLGVFFTLILAVPVALFFWFAAYSPATLAGPAGSGGSTSVWIVLGVGLILYATLLNALYVVITNRAAARAGARAAGTLALLVLAVLASCFAAQPARAAEAGGGPNGIAVSFFVVLVAATLAITYWAARHTRSTTDFYAAGGHLTAMQNGLAMAGDTISAGAFLGLSGLTYASGYDGLLYATGYCVAYPVIGILFADRMRNLGRFTFADVVSYRLQQGPVRILAALSTLTIAIFFLISQMVGAGQLVQLLFNIDYDAAEVIVGVLMVCYVLFGGMMATTWVQIVKAVLMLVTGAAISCLILNRFGWSYDALLARATELHPRHLAMLAPAGFSSAPLSTLSLGLAMFVGSAGLPHLIMRVFTVADARTARSSMFLGVICISSFFALISIIGLGAVALVAGNPDYVLPGGALRGGGNMAAVHLSHAVGGDLMLGFVAAVAFATIIAVVAGLTLSGAAAVSHDIYASVIRRGRVDERTEVRISRAATVVLGLLAVGLGIAFRGQNIAYLIGLVVGIAAAANFPLLVLSLYWRGLTTRGAVLGGATGLGLSVVLTVLGPSVWVKVLGHAAPVFPLDPPTLVALPAAVVVCVAVSLLDRSRRADIDRAGYAEQSRRMHGVAAPVPVLAAAE